MSWNYRVVKSKDDDGEEYFAIHEVYYNKDGSIKLMTEEPVSVGSDTAEGIKWVLQKMVDSLKEEVLVDGEIVFVDADGEK
jgi:hypothetical protein